MVIPDHVGVQRSDKRHVPFGPRHAAHLVSRQPSVSYLDDEVVIVLVMESQ
jgi:hypothetical protein